MFSVVLALAALAAASADEADPVGVSKCRQAVDVASSDIRLIRRLEVDAGSYVVVPMTGCGASGCQNIDMTIDLLGQGARMSVFGMTDPMMRNVQQGSPLVGIEGWNARGAECFSLEGASTPEGADTFFVVAACDHAGPPPEAAEGEDAAQLPASKCSMDFAANFTASCPAHEALAHDGSPSRAARCGADPSGPFGGCEAPAAVGLTVTTHRLVADDALAFAADGCDGPGGCRDFNLTVIATGGSAVDVFHVPVNLTLEDVPPGNVTHLHLYGLMGPDWQTADALPSRLDAERAAGAATAEVGADGSVEGDDDDDAPQSKQSLCPAEPSIDGFGETCETAPVAPTDAPRAPEEGVSAAGEEEAGPAPGPPARVFAASDPDPSALSRPVSCFQRRGLTVPASAGASLATVVVCSSPADGSCAFTVRQTYIPADGVEEDSRPARRLAESRDDQHVLQGTWEPEPVLSAEEEAAKQAEAAAAAAAEAAARRAEASATSPECLRFVEMRDAAAGAGAEEEEEGPGRSLWTGSERLPVGATSVMEMRPGCRGRDDCGEWRASAALAGAEDGTGGGGQVRVWATTLSGHRNVTATGGGALELASGKATLPCSAASTAGRAWPAPASVDDGGVFWMLECRDPPHLQDECDIRYVIKRGD